MVPSDWSDAPLEDFEYPEESDYGEDSDELETLPCPSCGVEIYEDSPACPYCGSYVTFSTSIWANHSKLWIGLGSAGILAVLLALILGSQ